MKHILASLFDVAKAAILLSVVAFGTATLSAQSTWTPAPPNPPANNVPAPVNVSNLPQHKLGALRLGTNAVLTDPIVTIFDVLGLASTTMLSTDTLLVSKAVTFAAGSPMKRLLFGTTGLSLIDGTQGAGKVLTSDASGRATWQVLPAATGGSGTANACSWKSTGSGMTGAQIISDGATGVCRTTSGGNTLLGNVETRGGQTNAVCFQAGDTNTLSTGSFEYYSCTASSAGGTPTPAGSCDTTPFRAAADFARNTTYQNTSGTQLIVMATGGQSQTGGGLFLEGYIGTTAANLTRVSFYQFQSTNVASITFLVPPGYYYKVVNDSANSPTLNAQAWKVCGGSATSGATGGGAVANSGNLTIPSADATSVSWSHGLGQTPSFVRVVLVSLVNQTSAQGSYLAGEELDVSNSVAVPSGGNYISIPTLATPTQVILPHQWASYPLHISANRVGAYNTGIAIDRSTWAIKIYAGTSIGSSGGGSAAAATAGVSSIVAGPGTTVSPASGTGTVTVGMSPGQGMMGDVPDAILCQSPTDTSKVIMYAQGVNTVSWGTPGRRIYSSDSDAGPHLTVYFHPTTGAWIDDVVGLSQSYTNAINGCRNKNLSQQTGFKFAGVNNVTATPEVPSGSWCGLALTSYPPVRLCQGLNPSGSCPTGYTRSQFSERPGYTCIKD